MDSNRQETNPGGARERATPRSVRALYLMLHGRSPHFG